MRRAILSLLFLLLCRVLSAQPDDKPVDDAQQMKRWRTFYQQRAEEFEVLAGDDERKLELRADPLQAYSNPVRSAAQHGTIHLWTSGGRPQLIGSVWSAIDQKEKDMRNVCYEFHSLSEQPLTVKLKGKKLWHPTKPGLEWQPLTDVPAPAATRPARLAQMRRMLADMRATIDTKESELRLLTQPVYRYEKPTDEALDGAIFSFVMGTDPELFVLLEARKSKEKDHEWQFAPVRFTGGGLSLKRGDKVLWDSAPWEDYQRDKVYDFLFGVEKLPAVWPEE